jgi:hypothetical protein
VCVCITPWLVPRTCDVLWMVCEHCKLRLFPERVMCSVRVCLCSVCVVYVHVKLSALCALRGFCPASIPSCDS